MVTCQHDSGSATGCRPLCDAEASHVVSYRNGSGPALRAMVCAAHVRVTEARAFPGHETTDEIPAGWIPAGTVTILRAGSYVIAWDGGGSRASGTRAPGELWPDTLDATLEDHGLRRGEWRDYCDGRGWRAVTFTLDWSRCPA